MSARVIVFDFDGTIIKDDTFLLVLNLVIKKLKRQKILYKFILKLMLKLLSKKMISNTIFKKFITIVLLKGLHKNDLERECINLAQELMNKDRINSEIFNTLLQYLISKEDYKIIIASATPIDIVKPILNYLIVNFSNGNYKIIDRIGFLCSEFDYKNQKITRFAKNLFGIEKRNELLSLGIERIHILFTDSYDDLPLIKIAENVYIVKDRRVLKFQLDNIQIKEDVK